MSTAAEMATPKARRARGGRSVEADKQKSEPTVKKTIVMPRKLHCLLSSVATFQDMDASELASKLIDRGLKASYGQYCEALDSFKPKVNARAKPDASGDNTDRQDEVPGASGDVEE